MSIARTLPTAASCRHARTGGQRNKSRRLYGYARVSVASDADANNLETQRRVLADCEQVFEDVGSGPSESRVRLVVSLHDTLTTEFFGATMLISRVIPGSGTSNVDRSDGGAIPLRGQHQGERILTSPRRSGPGLFSPLASPRTFGIGGN